MKFGETPCLVVIESPFAGDLDRNIAYARRALRDSLLRGEAPFASHLLYPGVLDDAVAEERAQGIAAGYAWGHAAGLVAFYVDFGYSPGMRAAQLFYSATRTPMVERLIGQHEERSSR